MRKIHNGIIFVSKKNFSKYEIINPSEIYMKHCLTKEIDTKENWKNKTCELGYPIDFSLMDYCDKSGENLKISDKEFNDYLKLEKDKKFMRHRDTGVVASEYQWLIDIDEYCIDSYKEPSELFINLYYVTKEGKTIFL